jgi:uncharacterized protein (TIGR02145 family)
MADNVFWNYHTNTGAVGNTDYPTYRNKTGLSFRGGGFRDFNGIIGNIGNDGYWWSSSQYGTNDAWNRHLSYYNSYVNRKSLYLVYGFSVRCIKD